MMNLEGGDWFTSFCIGFESVSAIATIAGAAATAGAGAIAVGAISLACAGWATYNLIG